VVRPDFSRRKNPAGDPDGASASERAGVRYLSPANLAARWDCSNKLVYKKINQGELKVLRIGALLRISIESVEEFEEANRR
jgi:excisionase family DNA binding protein